MSTSETRHGAAGPEEVERFGYRQELQRSLSFRDLLIYGLIFMVPIAPFGIFGAVYNGSGGMVALAYVIGIVAMAFTALSYASMSREFPVAGSVYSYAGRGLHPSAGFMAGWLILLDYVLVPALLYIVAAFAMHSFVSAVPVWAWIVLFIVVNTAVNYFGIKMTARVNMIMLAAELVVLAIFLVVGIIAIAGGKGEFSLRPLYDPTTFSVGLVFSAVSVAVLSFLGFDGISTLAEENTGDDRTVGRATLAALALAGTLFIIQTWVAALLVPNRERLLTEGDPEGTAFYSAAEVAGGEWLSVLTAVATAVAWGFANALVAQAATSRLLFSMDRDRQLPRFLAKVHHKHHVPEYATFVVAAVSLVAGIWFSRLDDGLTILTTLVNFGALTAFLLLHASVIGHFVFRRRSRNYLRHLVAPAIGFLIIAYVIVRAQVAAQITGITWLLIGLAVLTFFYATGRRPELSGMDEAPTEGTGGSSSVEEEVR